LESDDPTLQNVEKILEEFHDPVHHQALAFEYFSEAYIAFFNGADVFEEQDKALEARYSELTSLATYSTSSHSSIAKKNEKALRDLEEQKEKLAQLQAELSQLQSSAVRSQNFPAMAISILLSGTLRKTPEDSRLPRERSCQVS